MAVATCKCVCVCMCVCVCVCACVCVCVHFDDLLLICLTHHVIFLVTRSSVSRTAGAFSITMKSNCPRKVTLALSPRPSPLAPHPSPLTSRSSPSPSFLTPCTAEHNVIYSLSGRYYVATWVRGDTTGKYGVALGTWQEEFATYVPLS
jgi:hypothetical protein